MFEIVLAFCAIAVTALLKEYSDLAVFLLSIIYLIIVLDNWAERDILKDRVKALDELHKAELREKQIEDYKKGLDDK